MPDSEFRIPNDSDVNPENIEPDADLRGANLKHAGLRGANLKHADLTNANLKHADLTNANLKHADLTNANLKHADLTDVDLYKADLIGARLELVDLTDALLVAADLTGANLGAADLTDANLGAADLTDALLGELNLSGTKLSRTTQVDAPDERITNELTDDGSTSEENVYDIIARTNHELQTAYSANGLIGSARSARVRERRARRKEALAEGGLLSRGTAAWFGSLLSKVFTGYGVQIRWVVGVMLVLYLRSGAVYAWEGMPIDQSLYYSVVTFTTAPPTDPADVEAGFGTVGTLTAGIETFAGTAAIVFLGYVLGTRERV